MCERCKILEKAYRYQRAAWRLQFCACYWIEMNTNSKVHVCWDKAREYSEKANELYKQAEEL